MNSILDIYHRPTVSREYKTADDFAAQVVGSEDLDEVDIVALETDAKKFWRGCRVDFPVEGVIQAAWAQARLLPELVDALRWALSQVEDDLDPDHRAALTAARKVLAQAERGQP